MFIFIFYRNLLGQTVTGEATTDSDTKRAKEAIGKEDWP